MSFIVQLVIKAEFQQLKDGLLRFSRGMLTLELIKTHIPESFNTKFTNVTSEVEDKKKTSD